MRRLLIRSVLLSIFVAFLMMWVWDPAPLASVPDPVVVLDAPRAPRAPMPALAPDAPPPANDAEPAWVDAPSYRPTWSWSDAALGVALYGPLDGTFMQGPEEGFQVLCDTPSRADDADVDAWVESVLWSREARSAWSVARRATGSERVRILRLAAKNQGMEDCALADRLTEQLRSGEELPIIRPTHGSVASTTRRDRAFVAALERGESGF